MNGEVFQEWFRKILATIGEGSVIVMDNAPYHSVRSENIPNMSWRKQRIVNWLQSKGVPLQDDLIKPELLKLVQVIKPKYNTYVIDEIAKTRNCEVLRLPPYHCNLNPIELVWAQVKAFVAANNTTFNFEYVKDLLLDGIQNITAEIWNSCIQHVIVKEENVMWDADNLCDSLCDENTFKFNLADLSDSESDLSGIEEL